MRPATTDARPAAPHEGAPHDRPLHQNRADAAALVWLAVERTIPAAGASSAQKVIVTEITYSAASTLSGVAHTLARKINDGPCR